MEAWGCTNKGLLGNASFSEERLVDVGEGKQEMQEFRYWGCPLKFVPHSIWQFVAGLRDFERFPNLLTLRHDQRNPVWNDALHLYDCEYAEALKEMRRG
jgi:hypothetical protein